jgi:hypothetical protein
MKAAKKNTPEKKLPKSFKINSALTNKYANEPLFKEKIEKANHLLKTIGLPKI